MIKKCCPINDQELEFRRYAHEVALSCLSGRKLNGAEFLEEYWTIFEELYRKFKREMED